MLLLLAALAQQVHVSIMLAGSSLGLAVATIGPPRRLARQLFGVSEALLAPLFFIWLGASLDLRELGQQPRHDRARCGSRRRRETHAAAALTGAPVSMSVLGAAQLGVPVAAATLGTQLQLPRPGEAAGSGRTPARRAAHRHRGNHRRAGVVVDSDYVAGIPRPVRHSRKRTTDPEPSTGIGQLE